MPYKYIFCASKSASRHVLNNIKLGLPNSHYEKNVFVDYLNNVPIPDWFLSRKYPERLKEYLVDEIIEVFQKFFKTKRKWTDKLPFWGFTMDKVSYNGKTYQVVVIMTITNGYMRAYCIDLDHLGKY